MGHKHLHELLNEEQEPFHLKDYIALRKSQLKTSPKAPQIPRKCKTTPRYPNCFISVQYSPDIRNSPLIKYRSPVPTKSPNKSPKSVPIRLQVPARTASLLFEAAIKIQTQKKSRKQIKNIGFNLFTSVLKKLSKKSRPRKCEDGNAVGGSEISGYNEGLSAISCSRDNSSCVWSESNEDKSISTECFESEDFGGFSPFRFALQECSSPAHHTPLLLSPAMSPNSRRKQENENCKSKEEEEKEQFSPVSILDPPFEDDDNTGNDSGDDLDSYDIESSYNLIQRAKQQLLDKLCRFEKLAEFDPNELEKRMFNDEKIEELEDNYKENKVDACVNDVLGQVDISRDIKKLVFDLVNEENREGCNDDVAKMVRKRLDCWNEVKPNTIDMMVEFDFRLENEEWKGNGKDEIAEISSKFEIVMFESLVEELSEDLF